MNFYEQELRKIIGTGFPQATYVGRACYIPLGELLRAKIQFTTCGCVDKYEGLCVTILNRHEGKVDEILLEFDDLLGLRPVDNPNFPQGIIPHIWVDGEQPRWYEYKPMSQDYDLLGQSVQSYIGIFLEQRQTDAPAQQFQQSM